MGTTAEQRRRWAAWRCNTGRMDRVTLPGSPPMLVADITVPAWEELGRVMDAHNYRFRESAGGTYNCRPITGGSGYSLHAYGIALDLNPSKNPYGTHRNDYPSGFTRDVLAIRTVSGERVFRWGDTFSDPMHWEITTTPTAIRSGIRGAAPTSVAPARLNRLLRRSRPYMRGADVKVVQTLLNAAGASPRVAQDGVYGPRTESAVRAFQSSQRITVDGIVGPVTFARLLGA